jgi:hypothetical protein
MDARHETFPDSDPTAGRTEERLERAASARERRLTSLFRRWGHLNAGEVREFRRLWDERIRFARRGRW